LVKKRESRSEQGAKLMKFGKHIRSVAFAAWADRYVDYKGLKKLLTPLEGGRGTAEQEQIFLSAMHAEIDKVKVVHSSTCFAV
jgi:SPX domain protein involved in polyphosphate accumulation